MTKRLTNSPVPIMIRRMMAGRDSGTACTSTAQPISTIMRRADPDDGPERREVRGGAPGPADGQRLGQIGADQDSAHHKRGREHQREPDGEAQRPGVDGVSKLSHIPNATPGILHRAAWCTVTWCDPGNLPSAAEVKE